VEQIPPPVFLIFYSVNGKTTRSLRRYCLLLVISQIGYVYGYLVNSAEPVLVACQIRRTLFYKNHHPQNHRPPLFSSPLSTTHHLHKPFSAMGGDNKGRSSPRVVCCAIPILKAAGKVLIVSSRKRSDHWVCKSHPSCPTRLPPLDVLLTVRPSRLTI
jgi:hypothetical protein